MAKDTYFYGLGRRKACTARARLTGGKGEVVVNGKKAEDYFCGNEAALTDLLFPVRLIGKDKAFNISLVVSGGGLLGQVDACKLAISKALATMNEDLRSTLKKARLLMRDPREKEPKKYGLRSARKREQYSKR